MRVTKKVKVNESERSQYSNASAIIYSNNGYQNPNDIIVAQKHLAVSQNSSVKKLKSDKKIRVKLRKDGENS